MEFSGDNEKLADSCQNSEAACCKKGKIFLPHEQYDKLIEWLNQNSSKQDLSEFMNRCEDHGSYYLYNQQDGCQFLNDQNLCRLHVAGVKPLECFWWPLHIYINQEGSLFVGAADYCCGGCGCDDMVDHVKKIEQQAEAIGKEVIKAFREIFPGTQKYKTLKVLV